MGNLLSFDIGRRNIHVVEGAYQKGTFQIEHAENFPVPEGSMNETAIVNQELLADTIGAVMHRVGFKAKEAVVTLDAPGAVIYDVALPGAKPRETAEMIKAEMIQAYHIAPTDIIQFKTIESPEAEADDGLVYYRAAALNDALVESYRQLLLALRLKPLALDLHVNAIDKLFASGISVNDKLSDGIGTMFIDMGDSLTTVYIASQGKAIFYRHLDFGSGDIERIIAQETFASEGEVRKMKEEGFNFLDDSEDAKRYAAVLRPYFYTITDEIRKIIEFYRSRNNKAGVDKIFLFGGGSSLGGLGKYYENSFGIPTEQVLTLSGLKHKNPAIPIWRYLNALGAMIRNS